ncbi:hypothetical protein EVG20_g7829 [Dentipellis fragilis]|uniref:F-box domain-containing protein n=1 Tax=Dentipellis fragilis TaxID=205917 RepID=A0A4Y9YCN9_9AGAM|nr:hypothetical protein EVG20_g7829 [Dentipellis fragilis]
MTVQRLRVVRATAKPAAERTGGIMYPAADRPVVLNRKTISDLPAESLLAIFFLLRDCWPPVVPPSDFEQDSESELDSEGDEEYSEEEGSRSGSDSLRGIKGRQPAREAGPRDLGWIVLTHVCRRWRQLGINAAPIWTDLSFALIALGHRWTTTMLNRAQDLGIRIVRGESTCNDNPRLMDYEAEFIVSHLDKIVELRLLDINFIELEQILEDKPCPAPRLRVLELTEGSDATWEDGPPILNCPMPNLRSLALHFCGVPWTLDIFGGLVYLELGFEFEGVEGHSLYPAYPQLFDVLRKASATLQTLKLDMLGDRSSGRGSDEGSKPAVSLPHLTLLELSGEPCFIVRIFRHLGIPDQAQFNLCPRYWPREDDAYHSDLASMLQCRIDAPHPKQLITHVDIQYELNTLSLMVRPSAKSLHRFRVSIERPRSDFSNWWIESLFSSLKLPALTSMKIELPVPTSPILPDSFGALAYWQTVQSLSLCEEHTLRQLLPHLHSDDILPYLKSVSLSGAWKQDLSGKAKAWSDLHGDVQSFLTRGKLRQRLQSIVLLSNSSDLSDSLSEALKAHYPNVTVRSLWPLGL